jgi:hypothetical protein
MSTFFKSTSPKGGTCPNLDETFLLGQKTIINGERKILRYLLHQLSADYTLQNKRVLIVDTINSLNPHHPVFNTEYQQMYFKQISCVRTPMPYDLWARLETSGSFIRNKHIDVLIITSLSLLFKESPIKEVEPMIFNIFKRIDTLTNKYQLITIIANSQSSDDSAKLAYGVISKQKNVLEVKA